jgi:phage repressor protein C with HTH and peptisase S24 domain
MFTHADIWRALDRLAVTFGYSPSGLARKAGLDPTTFNKSKRVSGDGKPRWPSTESIAKVLAVTGMTMSEFFTLSDEHATAPKKAGHVIPLLGFAQAGRAGFFDEDGCPTGTGWDHVTFPAFAADDDGAIYALEVSGDSMNPLYRDGDVIVVSCHAPLRRGDRVVARLKSGEVMLKELTRQTAARVELKSLNPAHDDLSLTPEDLSWLARIIWVSQ